MRPYGLWVLGLSAGLFLAPRPSEAQTTDEELETAAPVESAEDTDELALDGVIVARNPADSIALVRRTSSDRARALRVGQGHAGYALVEVARDSVVLEGPKGTLRLYLSGESELTPRADNLILEERRARLEDQRWIRRAFPGEESRRRLEKEIGVILGETRLDPNVEAGEVRGLRLQRLPDGTLLSESGLLPGDVLLSLNEEPLSDLDALWETLAHLDGEKELRLVVDRKGALLRLAYDLID